MPLFNDPYYSSSFSHYYVPTTYSVSGRTPFSFSYMSPLSSMLSAGIGSNPVPRGMLSSRTYSPLLPSISETNSPILTRRDYSHRISPRNISGKTYFRAPRPVVINTETIDVSSRRNATTDEDDDSTAPGRIHRGRTVVRMHTKKLKENPGLRKKKTQGELLVEKFLIKEKPEPKEEPLPRRRRVWEVDDDSESPENNICRRGTIKRYTSGVRKKSGPLPDILDAVASKDIVLPRKVSVNDELLKEEAAILDCMIQEEMGRPVPEEVPAKRKKTGELLDVESISKRKTKRESRTYTTKKSSKTLPLDSLDGNKFVKKAYSKKKSSKTLPLDSVDETDNNDNKDLVINNKKINSDLNVSTRQKVYSRKKSPRLLPLDSVHETGVIKDNVLVEPCDLKLSDNKMYNKRKSSKYLAVPEVLSSEDNVIKNINIQTSVGEIEKKSYNKTNSVSPKFVIDSIHVEETLSPKLPKKLINYEVIIEETTDSDIDKRKRSSENSKGLKKIKKQSNKKGDKGNIVEREKSLISSTEDSCSSLEDTSYINKLHSTPGLEDAGTLNENQLSEFKKEVTSSEKESECDPNLEKPIIQNISDNILSEKPKDIKYTNNKHVNSSKENCEEAENINSITERVVDGMTDNCKENTICLMETNKELDRNKLFAKKVLEKAVEANKVDRKLKKNNVKVQVESGKLVKTQAKDKNLIAENLGNVKTPQKVLRSEIDISTQLHTSSSDLFNVDIPINDKKNTLSKEEALPEKNIPSQSNFLEKSGKKDMNKLKKQLKTELSENKYSILKGHDLKSEQVSSSVTVTEPRSNEQETNLNVSQEINVDNKLVQFTKLENKSNENDDNVKSTILEYDNPIEHQLVKSECNISNIKHEGSFLKSSKKNTLMSLKEPKDVNHKMLKNENCSSLESKPGNDSQTTNKETTESINKQEIKKDEVTKSVLPENSKSNDKLLTSKTIKKQFSVDDFSVKKTSTVVENTLQTDSNQLEEMILVPHSATKEEIPTEKITANSNDQTNLVKNINSQEEIKGDLSIKGITHSKDMCLGENKTSKSLSSSKTSENKDELSLIQNKKFNLTKSAGLKSEQPKQEAVKPTKKVNQLIKAFSSEESRVVAKQNNISEISKKDKPISFRKNIFEATKASSLDETKICDQSTIAVFQAQDDSKSLRNDLHTELNNIDNRTDSINIPEIDQISPFSPKTKHLVKVLNIDDNLGDLSEKNEELGLVTLPETCIELLTDDNKPDSPKLGINESSSFEKTKSTSEVTESKKRTLPKESKTSTVLEENKSNTRDINVTKAVDALVKPITDSSVSSTGCVSSEKEFKAKETNKRITQKTSIEEINSDNKLEQQTLITVTSDKTVCESIDEPRNVSLCSVDSTIEGTNSEEETSSEEESYEESSDEEPSGKVSFSDESSDEVGTSYRANGSRTDSGFNSPSSSLLETPACSPEGSTESKERGSPTRRYSNAALSLDGLADSQDGRGFRSGRVTPPATTIPRYRKYTIEDFQFLKVLGKGSFGKVLLAELRGTQYYYAVKCLKKDVVLEDDDVECTLIERKVLALGTKHPYLCHLFCTFQTESHLFFVMEYLNGGDLMFHIQTEGRFDEGRARFYAAEIVSGLKFLHSKGIVYRDLKLDNILLDFDGHVRIADFGMCKLQIYLDRMADTFCGTPDYMAPEIIKGLKYNQGVDWWSFGVLLYEMLVGQSPFSGCDEDDLFWCICNKQPQYPRYITLEGKTMLRQLLEKDSSKRLGSSESGAMDVIMHPFFNGLDWTRLERRELMPPFKPDVSHPLDVQYFDKAFTAERARLTPVEKSILQSMDQTQFQGFTYTNPNCTE